MSLLKLSLRLANFNDDRDLCCRARDSKQPASYPVPAELDSFIKDGVPVPSTCVSLVLAGGPETVNHIDDKDSDEERDQRPSLI